MYICVSNSYGKVLCNWARGYIYTIYTRRYYMGSERFLIKNFTSNDF